MAGLTVLDCVERTEGLVLLLLFFVDGIVVHSTSSFKILASIPDKAANQSACSKNDS
jgi:hypothetical protein